MPSRRIKSNSNENTTTWNRANQFKTNYNRSWRLYLNFI